METVIEAVIISGPRRGEIIQLLDEDIAEVCERDSWLTAELVVGRASGCARRGSGCWQAHPRLIRGQLPFLEVVMSGG